LADDPFVCYNFHYFEPQVFTHQQAEFLEEMREFYREVGYPDDISDFGARTLGSMKTGRGNML